MCILLSEGNSIGGENLVSEGQVSTLSQSMGVILSRSSVYGTSREARSSSAERSGVGKDSQRNIESKRVERTEHILADEQPKRLQKTPTKPRIVILPVLLLLAAVATACGGGDSSSSGGGGEENQVTLRLASALEASHPYITCGADPLAEQLQEDNTGIQLEVFAGGQLGDDQQASQQTQSGDVDIVITTFSTLAQFYERLSVFDATYLMRDADHLEAVFEGDVGTEVREEMLK